MLEAFCTRGVNQIYCYDFLSTCPFILEEVCTYFWDTYLITFSTAHVLLLLICYRCILFILIWSVFIFVSFLCVSGKKVTLVFYSFQLVSVRLG